MFSETLLVLDSDGHKAFTVSFTAQLDLLARVAKNYNEGNFIVMNPF